MPEGSMDVEQQPEEILVASEPQDDLPPLPTADPWEESPTPVSHAPEVNVQDVEAVTSRSDPTPALQAEQLPRVAVASSSEIVEDVQEGEPRIITVMLDSTGDRTRDALRMRRVHGLLNSYPGQDRFAFLLYEAAHRYLLEFPSSSTGYCAELHAQLVELVGEHRIRVEKLRYQ
jgi:hypothetical protein